MVAPVFFRIGSALLRGGGANDLSNAAQAGAAALRPRIHIDDRNLKKKMAALKAELGSKNMMSAIGMRQLRWIDEHFKTGGHGTWPGIKSRPGSPLLNTGRLRASFTHRVGLFGHSVTVGTTNEVAPYHHFGTKPYTISARDGGSLMFVGRDGPVFRRSVRHPGLAARGMLPDTREVEQMTESLIKASMQKIGQK